MRRSATPSSTRWACGCRTRRSRRRTSSRHWRRGASDMKNFQYYRPSSPEQAIGLLGKTWGKVELLAGGTDLLDLQKEHIAEPDKVVSLSGLGKDFQKIEVRWPPGTQPPAAFIGAGTRLA